jgi:hypothetical protein
MNLQRGSATVSMAAIALAMVVMASVGYGLASAVMSQRQVTIATDSAALAAADVRVGVRPGDDSCAGCARSGRTGRVR